MAFFYFSEETIRFSVFVAKLYPVADYNICCLLQGCAYPGAHPKFNRYSAGFGFAEAAIEAVKKSAYRAARKDGFSVLSRALLPVRFELTK